MIAHKVIVWGTGVVGKLVIRELLDHPEFELADVIVHDPAGKHVVSTSMTPLVYPDACPVELRAELEKACAESGKACFTTGIDPGFANDLFPLTLLGVCGRVDSVRIQELVDYASYVGDYSKVMGFGLPVDSQAVLEIPEVLIFAWGHTIPMIADAAV